MERTTIRPAWPAWDESERVPRLARERVSDMTQLQLEEMQRKAPARGHMGPIVCSPIAALIAAIILVHQRKHDAARAVLLEEIEVVTITGYGDPGIVRDIAAKLGLSL
jgi:hypothetical protein